MTSVDGAGAVPAGRGSSPPFPGGLGIILPALGPAREVLHWTGTGYGAGNTRGAACGPRPEGRPKDRTLRPRPRKHGLTPSLGDESPFGESREWNAGRRARLAWTAYTCLRCASRTAGCGG